MEDKARLKASRDYWRKAYELLVEQTGRDLNDGLGRDPRAPKPRSLSPSRDRG